MEIISAHIHPHFLFRELELGTEQRHTLSHLHGLTTTQLRSVMAQNCQLE
jgi:hypothetical protein